MFLPIFVGIPHVEQKILAISWNHLRNSLYIPYKFLKYTNGNNFRLIYAINFILSPSNNIKGRNTLRNFGQFWVTWHHVTSLSKNRVFWDFGGKIGAKFLCLIYKLIKNREDMWKNIVLASKKSKRKPKISFITLWD